MKVEDIKNKVGYSERTDAVIEPRLSLQWFLKMSELAKPALEAVLWNTVTVAESLAQGAVPSRLYL